MEQYDHISAKIFAGLVLFILGTLLCVATPFWIAETLGFEREAAALTAWLKTLDVWISLACLAGIGLTGFFILLVAGVTLYETGRRIMAGILTLAGWLVTATQVAVKAVMDLTARAVSGLIWLVTLPFRLIGKYIGERLNAFRQRIGLRLAEARALRALYAQEYADDFPSFRAFKRYWDALQRGEEPPYPGSEEEPGFDNGPDPEPEPNADPYQEALRELGLAEPFTRAEFKARYRMRMKEVHPDITGNTNAAMRVNAARDLIQQRKGWT